MLGHFQAPATQEVTKETQPSCNVTYKAGDRQWTAWRNQWGWTTGVKETHVGEGTEAKRKGYVASVVRQKSTGREEAIHVDCSIPG